MPERGGRRPTSGVSTRNTSDKSVLSCGKSGDGLGRKKLTRIKSATITWNSKSALLAISFFIVISAKYLLKESRPSKSTTAS